jgi:hypothetical protein
LAGSAVSVSRFGVPDAITVMVSLAVVPLSTVAVAVSWLVPTSTGTPATTKMPLATAATKPFTTTPVLAGPSTVPRTSTLLPSMLAPGAGSVMTTRNPPALGVGVSRPGGGPPGVAVRVGGGVGVAVAVGVGNGGARAILSV